MTEARQAIAGATCGIGGDIEDDVVRVSRVAGEERRGTWNGQSSPSGSHAIQMEKVADAPRDIVIGARRITADSNSTDKVRSCANCRRTSEERVQAAIHFNAFVTCPGANMGPDTCCGTRLRFAAAPIANA